LKLELVKFLGFLNLNGNLGYQKEEGKSQKNWELKNQLGGYVMGRIKGLLISYCMLGFGCLL